MSKSILIVGGTGFIGRNLCHKFLSEKFKVFVIHKNTITESKKIKNIKYIKCDCTKYQILKKKISNIKLDYVINASGYVNHGPFFGKSSNKIFLEHFMITKNLVEVLQKKNLKKFLQIGSSDEYGPEKKKLKENLRERPFSFYSFSKTASTHYLQSIYKAENFKATIVRIFLSYGPGQDLNRFFPQIIKGCLRNERFPTSYGDQFRDFSYIDDVVDGIKKILISKKTEGEIINLGSGKPVKIKRMVELIVKIIGKGIPVFGAVRYRKGENMFLVADVSKLKKLIKWKPKFSLEKGIRNTIKFYEKKF